PKPNANDIGELPFFQLYDLSNDPAEQTNLFGKHPEIENQLSKLIIQYIENGRSTPGTKQVNDLEGYGSKDWKQLKLLKDKLNQS
ncbi:MAG: arylsulfatase, partial [Maribacter sp.]|nr:arylsulfatase [Maribacter sp.]